VSYRASVTLVENNSLNSCGISLGLSPTTYMAIILDKTSGVIARDQTKTWNKLSRSWYTLNSTTKPLIGVPYDLRVKLYMIGTTRVMDVYVNNAKVAGGQSTSKWPQIVGNNAGLYSTGKCSFSNVYVATQSFVVLSVSKCYDPYLVNDIALALGVSASSLSISYPADCANTKRQLGTVEATVTITTEVSSAASSVEVATATSEVLAAQLVEAVNSLAPAIVASSAGITAAALTTEVVTGTIVTTIASASAITTLSAVLIGVGAFAGVAILAAGIGLAVAPVKSTEAGVDHESPRDPEQDEKARKMHKVKTEGKGINVFEMDPNHPSSITARGLATS